MGGMSDFSKETEHVFILIYVTVPGSVKKITDINYSNNSEYQLIIGVSLARIKQDTSTV